MQTTWTFWKTALFLVILALLPSLSNAATQPKPNILHIHADDHRPDGLRALGNPVLKTPNLDTLVEQGMTFSHCYTQGSMIAAVCEPSRAIMLTGRSWLHVENLNKKASSTFLPKVLSSAGYET